VHIDHTVITVFCDSKGFQPVKRHLPHPQSFSSATDEENRGKVASSDSPGKRLLIQDVITVFSSQFWWLKY